MLPSFTRVTLRLLALLGQVTWTETVSFRGHEATETGLAYAPVSQAHGHNHIVQCSACCTAA